MEQHPVPQNIASFNFKLFGNLTVRQFFTLIIPLSLAAIVYFSPIPSFIRIPISLIIGIFSFVIALVPINGMPFDKWAVAFIKAVMSPTQRVWIKEKKIPDFLTIISTPPKVSEKIPEEISEKKKERLFAYLKTLPKENATPMDVKEEIALTTIDFTAESPPFFAKAGEVQRDKYPPPIIWHTSLQSESVSHTQEATHRDVKQAAPPTPTEAHNLAQTIKLKDVNLGSTQIPHFEDMSPRKAPFSVFIQDQKPKIAAHAKPYVVKGLEKRLAGKKHEEYINLMGEPAINLASDTNYTTDNIITVRTPDGIKLVHGIGATRARKLHFAPPLNFDISKLPIRGEKRFEISEELKKRYQLEDFNPEVNLPIEKPTPVPQIAKPQVKEPLLNIPQKSANTPGPTGQQVREQPQKPLAQNYQEDAYKFSITDTKKQEPQEQNISQASIIPLTKTPNVISGQVVDQGGNSISGAVLVVRDSQGIPIRALKTNKLGQFLSATPLSSGTYSIETESELAEFSPLTLILKDKIVEPILISAQRISNGNNSN